MVGVVGHLKVCYSISENQYEEIIDPKTTSEFCLRYCTDVTFRIEEVTYIEDTIYGMVLSLIKPHFKEDEYMVGSDNANFLIENYGIAGCFSLCF